VLVVDSIQTATLDELEGPAGSVGQVRESALRYMELAKGDGIAVVLVGHVTKDGSPRGPKTLEHLVDAVLALEGERSATLRCCARPRTASAPRRRSACSKWGGGPARGRRSRPSPSSAITPAGRRKRRRADSRGNAAAAWWRSRRSSRRADTALPRRTANGVDPIGLALLIAVLGRRAGIGLAAHDVYVNLAGGLAVDRPALDLPLAIALASSLRDRPVRRRP
jgi:DNA repair protein RadA/Sms